MWGSGAPRIPATDEKGRLLWRETYSCKGTLAGRIWILVSSILYIAFFVLVREGLPPETFEPHLDSEGALVVWLALSSVATCITVYMMTKLVRRIRRSHLTPL